MLVSQMGVEVTAEVGVRVDIFFDFGVGVFLISLKLNNSDEDYPFLHTAFETNVLVRALF